MNDQSNGENTGNAEFSLPAKSKINLKTNGTDKQVEVATWTSLLDLLSI